MECDQVLPVGHGLPVVDAADGLRQDHADVNRFDFWTLELLELVGNRVGHHHLEEDEEEDDERYVKEVCCAVQVCIAEFSLTSSMADSSMNRGASRERMPCVAMT
ncbi:hypothetical protein EYF80_028133 [Liparis tanakae]|uniref:Uncharacterized protein n=1 Tax=Liparis tanakae TaxID=230148 RepID=A0A4Z2H6T1_9TELE|nr:hypothetical protein EYF80_028133 [Liparis tanakae]